MDRAIVIRRRARAQFAKQQLGEPAPVPDARQPVDPVPARRWLKRQLPARRLREVEPPETKLLAKIGLDRPGRRIALLRVIEVEQAIDPLPVRADHAPDPLGSGLLEA